MENSRWVFLFLIMKMISILFFPATSYANSAWLKYFRKDTLLNTYMRAYAVQEDKLWVGTYGDGVVVYNGDTTTNFNVKNTRSTPQTNDGLISDYITSIAIDHKKARVWLGTNEGLASCDFAGGEWERYTSRDGLPNDVIRDLAIDKKGCLWVGTPSGVARFNGDSWIIFDEKTGLHQDSVHSITVTGDSVWVGSVGGSVSRYRNGQWKLFVRH